jgi:hypothetical protein
MTRRTGTGFRETKNLENTNDSRKRKRQPGHKTRPPL